jgi:gliding motility-associated-like protein
MEDRNTIERLFKEALEHHEVNVRPEVWSSISQAVSAQSGAASAASSAASTGLTNLVAGMALVGLATVATINEVRYHEAQQNDGTPTAEISIENAQTPPVEKQNASFDEQPEAAVTTTTPQPQNSELNASIPGKEARVKPEVDAVAADEQSSAATAHSNDGVEQEGAIANSEPSTETVQDSPAASTTEQIADSQQDENQDDEAKTQPASAPEEPTVAGSEPSADQSEATQKKTMARFTHEAVQTITPNGDMYNEYFEVDGQDVAEFNIRIMTREGAVVFESRDINFQWNGLDRFGNPVPTGTYFYQIAAVGTDGLPYQEKNARGSIQVIRN